MKGIDFILDKQVNVYSVDTSAFFTRQENKVYRKLIILKREKKQLKDKVKTLKEQGDECNESIIEVLNSYIKLKNSKIKETKNKLIELLKDKLDENKRQQSGFIRHLSPKFLIDNNIISMFDGSNARLLHMKIGEISQEFIIVKTYYFDIIHDLIKYGFISNGEKYKFFTASAGQIRTKKTVFIKESSWNSKEKTFLCGLTIEELNRRGGMNINKFLAYLALGNSATDEWIDFDIDKTIVVPDFENEVNGVVDYINDEFEIERKTMNVPITQTDGGGMMLPCVSNKNFMIRLPWVKGLLAVFDFRKFIVEKNGTSIIKDIYGQEHDVIKEDIQIIFTESQFKAHSYYDSWEQYKEYFKQYNCQAGKCNVEEDFIPNAKINYQMLQTLVDITPSEIQTLALKSNRKIENLTSTVKSMQEAFGVTDKSTKFKTYLQEAIHLYPEILNDPYTKETIKQIKKSMVNNFRAGKLLMDSKYSFVVPDWYAVCENWFLGIKKPQGLLGRNQVSCNLYPKITKLDCLRSPHLYKEHAIRENVVNNNTKKWFTTNAIYIGIDDLISKLLMLDVDGDKLLIVTDNTFIQIAERNMVDIVPLYYDMRKAHAVEITPDNIYIGLEAAYTGGNIGIYSNSVSKIWNNDVWINGSEDEKQQALDTVKYLCKINNEVIDYAKTLYKSKIPSSVNDLIHKYTNCKLPHFFMYAKDKLNEQVEDKTNSTVNLLENVILDKRLTFKLSEFGKLDYKVLMKNPNIKVDNLVKIKYNRLNRTYHFQINMEDKKSNNFRIIAKNIDNTLTMEDYSREEISDMLVKYLYSEKNTKNKEVLWFCYGDIIVNNIRNNIKDKKCICPKCGKRFNSTNNKQIYCKDCGYKYVKIGTYKTIKCVDCGEKVKIKSTNNRTIRCDNCQRLYNNERKKMNRNKQK